MTKSAIHITESDMARLRQLTEARLLTHSAQLELLARLEEELDRAEVVDPDSLPIDVISMNSRVLVRDLDTGREVVHHLVFPAQSWGKGEALSVLAPLGIALLGYRVGDVVEARTPGGVRRVEVLALLGQPEREQLIA
ncbi:MAG: nucleoside diphosphate kinase regulator [Bryobacterales bacterium]|nr:nucleoside diphosphate kinase regulator [Bryobacterales bacterium]